MSILDSISEKAKRLIGLAEPYATRETNVYDASKNKIIVAGIPLDGVVSSNINNDILLKQENGIDYYYTTMYQTFETRTLTVNILPTAQCLPILRDLSLKQQQVGGWFNISVFENGSMVDVYRAWVLNLPDRNLIEEAPDRSFVFGIKAMNSSGVTVIDQPTITEDSIYSKYGSRPDLANGENPLINEDSGDVQDPYLSAWDKEEVDSYEVPWDGNPNYEDEN